MIKARSLFISSLIYMITGAIVMFLLDYLNMDQSELSFVLAAIVGVQVFAVDHHKQGGTRPDFKIKAIIGFVLALSAVILGLIMHQTFHPFIYPDVSIGISAVGGLILPFLLLNTFWKSLEKSRLK